MNALIEVLMLAFIGLVIGYVAGSVEAETTVRLRNEGKKIDHAFALIVRIVLSALMAKAIHGISLLGLYGFGIVMLSITLSHRQAYNGELGLVWYYMGPRERSKGDSVYDSICWWLATRLSGLFKRSVEPWMPWAIAVLAEVTALVLVIKQFLAHL